MELPVRCCLSRCRKSTSGRVRRRGSRRTQSKHDGHLSSAPKQRHPTSWTRGAPPFRDRPHPAF